MDHRDQFKIIKKIEKKKPEKKINSSFLMIKKNYKWNTHQKKKQKKLSKIHQSRNERTEIDEN